MEYHDRWCVTCFLLGIEDVLATVLLRPLMASAAAATQTLVQDDAPTLRKAPVKRVKKDDEDGDKDFTVRKRKATAVSSEDPADSSDEGDPADDEEYIQACLPDCSSLVSDTRLACACSSGAEARAERASAGNKSAEARRGCERQSVAAGDQGWRPRGIVDRCVCHARRVSAIR